MNSDFRVCSTHKKTPPPCILQSRRVATTQPLRRRDWAEMKRPLRLLFDLLFTAPLPCQNQGDPKKQEGRSKFGYCYTLKATPRKAGKLVESVGVEPTSIATTTINTNENRDQSRSRTRQYRASRSLSPRQCEKTTLVQLNLFFYQILE